MFIELTDHLRCPEGHAERFLVLLPDRMDGRRVVSGTLGCPVCGRVFPVSDGIVRLGDGQPATEASRIPPGGVASLVGIQGPGGYIALIGASASLAPELLDQLPGVRLVLINPPHQTIDEESSAVVQCTRLPLKRASMRSVVIGRPESDHDEWVRDGIEAVLPGNRVIVEGGAAGEYPNVELLASAEGIWVGRRS